MSVLFRRSSKTARFSGLLEVAIATSDLTNEVYNGGFSPEFSVWMLKEIIALVWEYVYETRKLNSRKQWILLRRSNRLSYQAMSSICTNGSLCTATPRLSFVECVVSFWLMPSSVTTFYFNWNFLEVITWV